MALIFKSKEDAIKIQEGGFGDSHFYSSSIGHAIWFKIKKYYFTPSLGKTFVTTTTIMEWGNSKGNKRMH